MVADSSSRNLILAGRGGAISADVQGESPVRVIPAWASPPDTHRLVMLGDTAKEASAELRVIRHRLEQKRADGVWSFGVTSSRDGEGKSTFAAQLALVLSESQRARVLLVEANFSRPSIAKVLGFAVAKDAGFSSQISRKMRGNMDPWCVTALGPALHVLAEEPDGESFPEALHSPHFTNALSFLSRGYDFLIVDSPSILGSGDANVVENAVDSMIVVARSKVTKGTDLRRALKQLGDRKTLGVVLWDATQFRRRG